MSRKFKTSESLLASDKYKFMKEFVKGKEKKNRLAGWRLIKEFSNEYEINTKELGKIKLQINEIAFLPVKLKYHLKDFEAAEQQALNKIEEQYQTHIKIDESKFITNLISIKKEE